MLMITVIRFGAKQVLIKPNEVNTDPIMTTTLLLKTSAKALAEGAGKC